MVSGFIEARVRITIQYLDRSFLPFLCLLFFLSKNEPRGMGERLEQQEIRDTNNNTRNKNIDIISGMIHSFEKALFKRIASYDIETLVKKID